LLLALAYKSAKEPYESAKEPHKSAKEPYTQQKYWDSENVP